MAKFTCTEPLNIAWHGNDLIGTSTTTYRIPDALYDEFVASVVPTIKGTVTWVSTDEIGAISTPAHSTLTGVTANQHHNQVHSISGADHTGSLAHSALASIGANDHHGQVHSISGADHTGTLTHAALGSVTADQHHAQSHNHSSASDGTTLSPATFNIPGGIGFSAATAFPGSPSTNQVCRRTDLGMEFYFDGTRWLSSESFELPLGRESTATFPLSATANDCLRAPCPALRGGSDIYLLEHQVEFTVASGGTALGASHKWEGNVAKFDGTGAQTAIANPSISSGTSGTYRRITTTINALLRNGTDFFIITTDWTKTGTPGTLNPYETITYRIVAT